MQVEVIDANAWVLTKNKDEFWPDTKEKWKEICGGRDPVNIKFVDISGVAYQCFVTFANTISENEARRFPCPIYVGLMSPSQKEAAARELCRLRGVDPDARIAHGADADSSGNAPAVMRYSPAWMRAALREIEAHEQIVQAMLFGRSNGD